MIDQEIFFVEIEKILQQADFETNRLKPTADAPFYTLVVRFDDVGFDQTTVDLQLSFITGVTRQPDEFQILQFFFELDNQVDESKVSELLWLTNQLNSKLPLGNFGLLLNHHVLYFKHNCLLSRSIQESLDICTELVERQLDVLLPILNIFMKQIMDVANGKISPGEAIKLNSLAEIYEETIT